MKKLLTIIATIFALTASAQSYISSNTNIILEASSPKEYASPSIFVHGEYYHRSERWLVTLDLIPTVFSATAGAYETYSMYITKAVVDGYTGTGKGDSEKVQNALEKAVGGILGAINVSTTFTIH